MAQFFSRWRNSICNFCSHFRYNIYVLITHMLNILSKIETYTRGLSPRNKQILPRSSPLSFLRVLLFVLSVSQFFSGNCFRFIMEEQFRRTADSWRCSATAFIDEKCPRCVLATNKRFFLRFLVSGVVHFPAKDVVIVLYRYFATCILGLMYNKHYSRKYEGHRL